MTWDSAHVLTAALFERFSPAARPLPEQVLAMRFGFGVTWRRHERRASLL